MNEKKPSFERSVETDLCLQLLLKAEPGDVVNWAAFAEALAQPLEDIRGNIMSARRIALSDHGLCFDSVRTVGLQRLRPGERAGVLKRKRDHIRRTAAQGLKVGATEDYDVLTPDQKASHNTEMTYLGLLRHVSRPKNVNRIGDVVKKTQKRLPLGRTLEALGVEVKEETEAAEE